MKRSFTLVALLFPTFFFSAKAQLEGLPTEGPGFYFNGFQKYKDDNVDSAMYFVRKLAGTKDYESLLEDLIHNSFAQSFLKSIEKQIPQSDTVHRKMLMKMQATGRLLLPAMMADSNQYLKTTVLPIYYWTQVQDNEKNEKRLQELVAGFIKTQLNTNDLYTNRVGRYALMIHQLIASQKALQPIAKQLLDNVTIKLKNNQIMVDGSTAEAALKPWFEKRAWFRYLYAYVNSIQGNTLLSNNKIKEAAPYLKTAFDYSPDMLDNDRKYIFFYDMYFLTEKEEPTFRDEYISYLKKHSADKQQTLLALTSTALIYPSVKGQLKEFYNSNFSSGESFTDYWIKNINQSAKDAPAFSLQKMDGAQFSLSNYKSKWILLDFWGTWCGPCRREHPEVESFYTKVLPAATDKITLLTIACRDKADNVTSYMTQNKYTFPVAMADPLIEKIYNIKSYPSKILISPQGKYLVVPFGSDWVDFVKKYADL